MFCPTSSQKAKDIHCVVIMKQRKSTNPHKGAYKTRVKTNFSNFYQKNLQLIDYQICCQVIARQLNNSFCKDIKKKIKYNKRFLKIFLYFWYLSMWFWYVSVLKLLCISESCIEYYTILSTSSSIYIENDNTKCHCYLISDVTDDPLWLGVTVV